MVSFMLAYVVLDRIKTHGKISSSHSCCFCSHCLDTVQQCSFILVPCTTWIGCFQVVGYRGGLSHHPGVFLLLLDLGELPAGQLRDLTENLSNALALSLNRHATELVLHLGNDTLCPPTDLVVDQLHVLLALLERLEMTLQLLVFGL